MPPPRGSTHSSADLDELDAPLPTTIFPAGLTSSRGRKVKPRTWDDNNSDEQGLEAAPSFSSRPQLQAPPRQRHRPPPSWRPPEPALSSSDDTRSEDEEEEDEEAALAQAAAQRLRRRTSGHLAAALGKRSSVPVRDETGRFIGVRPKTAAERAQANSDRGGGIFKSAAVRVLNEERRLMATGEVAKLALARGYINVMGKTPEATMASAMYTDVKRKGHEGTSTFIRPHEGLFGLREWQEKGIAYKDPMDEGFSNDEHTAAVIKKARLHASLEGASGHARSTLSHNFQLPHTARGSAPSGRHANGVMEEAGPQRRAGTTHRPIAGRSSAGPAPAGGVGSAHNAASAFQPASSGGAPHHPGEPGWPGQVHRTAPPAEPIMPFADLGAPHHLQHSTLAPGQLHPHFNLPVACGPGHLPGLISDGLDRPLPPVSPGAVVPSLPSTLPHPGAANAQLLAHARSLQQQQQHQHQQHQQHHQLAMSMHQQPFAPDHAQLAMMQGGFSMPANPTLAASMRQQDVQRKALQMAAANASSAQAAAAAAAAAQQGHLKGLAGQAGAEDPSENIMLLINAAEELHRSDSHGREPGSAEPSTAATPGGDGINKEDTAMQKAGASLVAADTASSGSVAGENKRQPGQVRQPSTSRTSDLDLTVQGFGVHRLGTARAGASDTPATESGANSHAINILNLHLGGDCDMEHGSLGVPEVDPRIAENAALDSPPQPASASEQAPQGPPSTSPLPGPSVATSPASAPGTSGASPPAVPGSNGQAARSGGPPPAPASHPHPAAPQHLASEAPAAGASQAPGHQHLPGASGAIIGRLLGPGPINMEDLMQLEMTVRGLEELHGQVHPQVGKAYLLLSKVYQKGNTVEMQRLAEQALQRSYDIIYACNSVQGGMSEQTAASFKYLMGKMGAAPAARPVQFQ